MKRRIIKIGLLIFLTITMMAQEQEQARVNSFGLSWGMGNIMRQDLTLSPFVHKDWSPINVQLRYERSKKLEQQASLKFGSYSPNVGEAFTFYSFYNGELTTWPHSFTMIDINYAIGKSISDKGKYKFVLGAKSKNQFYLSDYSFGSFSSSPIFIAFGLDIWLNMKYDINEKHHVESNVSLPIFKYVYRDPYLSQDDEFFENLYSHKPLKEMTDRIKDGQLQSWGSSQSFDFDLSYGYSLNEKWEFGCTYLLSMNFNQIPTKYAQIENVIYISGIFKF
jgi:hypothetical protein